MKEIFRIKIVKIFISMSKVWEYKSFDSRVLYTFESFILFKIQKKMFISIIFDDNFAQRCPKVKNDPLYTFLEDDYHDFVKIWVPIGGYCV